MKVITRSEMQWNGERYVVVAEESHEYNGPIALAKGGGDGGAAEMRRMEEERQGKTIEAMNKINAIFGGDVREFREEPEMRVESVAGTEDDPQRFERVPTGRMNKVWGPGKAVPGQFTDDYFTNIADAFMQFQQPLFEEQVRDARRVLPMRFGSTGSSAYQRKLGELERDVTREGALLRDRGSEFGNKQRMEVERNRADLTAMANAGTDASVLAQQAAARAGALSQPPAFEPISDLFQKYTAVAANNALAGQQGPIVSRPLNFPSRERSVRVVG